MSADKLFEVPRVAVELDESDPTVLKIAFSGSIEVERDNAKQVEHYNQLGAGEERSMTVVVHIAGAKKVHRRDSEGYVDAIVETKSLVVTDFSWA